MYHANKVYFYMLYNTKEEKFKMLLNTVFIIIGFIFLIKGADILVDGASRLS